MENEEYVEALLQAITIVKARLSKEYINSRVTWIGEERYLLVKEDAIELAYQTLERVENYEKYEKQRNSNCVNRSKSIQDEEACSTRNNQ